MEASWSLWLLPEPRSTQRYTWALQDATETRSPGIHGFCQTIHLAARSSEEGRREIFLTLFSPSLMAWASWKLTVALPPALSLYLGLRNARDFIHLGREGGLKGKTDSFLGGVCPLLSIPKSNGSHRLHRQDHILYCSLYYLLL